MVSLCHGRLPKIVSALLNCFGQSRAHEETAKGAKVTKYRHYNIEILLF